MKPTWLEALARITDPMTPVLVADILLRWSTSAAPTERSVSEWRLIDSTARERAAMEGVVFGVTPPPDWAEVEREVRGWCTAILTDNDGPGWPRAYVGYVVGAVVRFHADLALGPTRARLAPRLPGDVFPRLSDEVIDIRRVLGEMAVRDLSALVGVPSPF